MQINITEFPIVKIDYNAAYLTDFQGILTTLSQLLAKNEPFVIIGEGAPSDDDGEQSRADRREAGLWAKNNLEAIQRLIKIQYQVQPDEEKALEMEAFAGIFEKFWGYPLVVVNSVEEAYLRSKTILNNL